jgi:hypothetical protein
MLLLFRLPFLLTNIFSGDILVSCLGGSPLPKTPPELIPYPELGLAGRPFILKFRGSIFYLLEFAPPSNFYFAWRARIAASLALVPPVTSAHRILAWSRKDSYSLALT